MRMTLSLAAGAIAFTLLLPAPAVNAMASPAPAGLAGASETINPVEQVRRVCQRYWYRGRSHVRCYWVNDWRPYRSRHHRHWRRW